MKYRNTIHTPFILFIFLVMSIFSSCSTSRNGEVEEEDHTEMISDDVRISKAQFSTVRMELGKVEKHIFFESIKSYGVIDVPPENRSSVSAYFGGYVKKLQLLEGQKVKKGDLLFTLENPSYVEIQQEYLEAKGQLVYLQSDYERQKNLVKDNVSSQKKYLKSEADYQVTLVRFESLKKKLSLMNINPASLDETTIRSEIEVTAPLGGVISTVNATRGMYLNPDDIALTIINADHIHLDLHVFEKDLPKIFENQDIIFSLQNNPAQVFEAYVYLVGNYIDPVKRSASIHGHLKDEGESHYFIPGMYIEADIKSSSDSLISINTSAIVKVEEKYFVLVKVAEEGEDLIFEKREVLIGEEQKGFTVIKNSSDFSGSEDILINGAFNLINSGEGGGHEH